ncbi:hypothetical protein GGI12_003254 [Dipsacomyces acuminosporus]|nr:hypothetical protein GGI12_003254 [Dipsacomyces acuminosporus]
MEWRRISGYRLVSISLIVSIGFSVLAGLLALYHTESSKNNNEIGATRDRLPIILTPTVFMIIWMSFEIARVSLPMDYAANSSDAMFYCLSALPATCIILAWNNGIEEFLCLVAVGTNSNATGDGANRQGNEDYRLQEVVSRTASPSSKAAVAADGGGCCCNSNGKSRCAKCKYEAMLQHAMSKYT